MVLLGFTIKEVKPLILDGIKRRTVRAYRDDIKKGVRLDLYMFPRQPKMHLLFRAPCIETNQVWLDGFTLELAIADGFKFLEEMKSWFLATHKDYLKTIKYKKLGFLEIVWDYDKRYIPKKTKETKLADYWR